MLKPLLFILCLTRVHSNTSSFKCTTQKYIYYSNITKTSNPDLKLKEVMGQVWVTTYYPQATGQDNSEYAAERLAHLRAKLMGQNAKWSSELNGFVAFKRYGTVQQIYVPLEGNYKTTQLNLLKGIISLFSVRASLETGFERDSSGSCSVTYAIVDRPSENEDEMVFDKHKQNCTSSAPPVDVWNHNLIRTKSLTNPLQMFVRYWVNTRTNFITRVLAHEGMKHALFSEITQTEVDITSWQELLLSETTEDVVKIDGISHETEYKKIAEKVLHSEVVGMHLAPAFSLDLEEYSCGLSGDFLGHSLEQDNSIDFLSVLVSAVEDARDALQPEQLGSLEPLHYIMQLIRLMRCLPPTEDAVRILSHATNLAPPAIESNLLYRQANSWRDQLVEVLISCGTATCTEVILDRLKALSDTANLNVINIDNLSPEEKLVRKMLFVKLWPALAHLHEVGDRTYDKLIRQCEKVKNLGDRYICLNTLVNLWPHYYSRNQTTAGKLISMIRPLLVQSIEPSNSDQNTEEQSSSSLNSRLLVGVALTAKLGAKELLDQLLLICMNNETVWPIVRAAAIRSINAILKQPDSADHLNTSEFHSMKHLLIERLLTIQSDINEDLIIGRELFTTLFTLGLTGSDIAHILKTFGLQKRWPLMKECLSFARQYCSTSSVELPECSCFEDERKAENCDFGLASGWSGRAIQKNDETGQVNSATGDIININDSIIAAYDLKIITGIRKELEHSSLRVSIISSNEESEAIRFIINAHGMNVLVGYDGSEDQNAWLNIELGLFDTGYAPRTVFEGGRMNAVAMLIMAQSEPSNIFSFIRPIIDSREYASFSSGWLLRLDSWGIISTDVSGALEASIWTQSGRSLVRTRLGVTLEIYLRVVDELNEVKETFIQGIGAESELDFITNVKVNELPDGVCMSMNRDETRILLWNSSKLHNEFRLSRKNHYNYLELKSKMDYKLSEEVIVPGVSYNLGMENSRNCGKLKTKNIW